MKRHHKVNVFGTGGYTKGEYGQIWLRMETVPDGHSANGWLNDYDWDKSRDEWINNRSAFRTRNNTDIKKNTTCETVQTIMIDKGEYEWMTKSVSFDYGDGNNSDVTWLQAYGYRDFEVQGLASQYGFIGRPDLTTYDIQKMIGGWAYRGEEGVNSFFQNNQGIIWKIFRETSTGIEESKEWFLADEQDYLYLIGIMPNISGNFHRDAANFFCMSAEEDTLNLAVPLTRRRNVSGLSFAPLGRRPNSDDRHSTVGTQIYSYPSDCTFLLDNLKAFMVSYDGWSGQGSGIYMSSSDTTLHGAQIRYCRRVPDDKLGYKLIYNITTDTVNFVDLTWGSQWFQENLIPYNTNLNQIPGSWNGMTNYDGFIYLDQSAIQGKHISRLDNVRLRFYPDTNTSGTITIWKSTDNHGQNVIWEQTYTVNGVSDGTFSLDVDIDLGVGEFIGFGKSTDTTRLWFSATGFNPVAGGFYYRANSSEHTWDIGVGISVGDPTNVKPSDQDIIERNIERGVAMRYAIINKINILASTVSKKWSEIQAEAAQRKAQIKIV